jgi:hypothetical protein
VWRLHLYEQQKEFDPSIAHLKPSFVAAAQHRTFEYALPTRSSVVFSFVYDANTHYACNTSLPLGLTLDPQLGLLYGIPKELGTYSLTFLLVDVSSQLEATVEMLTLTVWTDASSLATSSFPLTAVIVSVILVGAFVIFVILLIFFLRARARPRRQRNLQPYDFEQLLAALCDMTLDPSLKRAPHEIKRSSIRMLNVIGKGNFGEVHKAFLHEIPSQPGYIVAVKTQNASLLNTGSILPEAALTAQFNSPFIVQLIGVVTIGDPLLVVMEYCEFGSLNNYLKKNPVSRTRKLTIALDCAEGLRYLDERNFVHRDIASRNVLISSDHRAKLSDFGMSRQTVEAPYYMSKGGQLPIRWTAPEGHYFFQSSLNIRSAKCQLLLNL